MLALSESPHRPMIKKLSILAGIFAAVAIAALVPISFPSGGIALAQVDNPVIVIVAITPTACSTLPLKIVFGTASLYGTNGSGGCTQIGGSVGGDTITSPNSTLSVGGTATATTLDLNLAKSNIWTANGALSAPAVLFNGLPIASGGTGTTTWPLVLIQPNGTTTTTWNTAGTMFGVNAPSGFSGNIFDFQANGGSVLKLSNGGTLTGSGSQFNIYQTTVVCASAASPAVCGSAAAGSVAVAAGTNPTLQVNTSRVTANSQIQLTEDQSLGARLSVTCQTVVDPTFQKITARTPGTSFTFQLTGTFTTNPVCYSYQILN